VRRMGSCQAGDELTDLSSLANDGIFAADITKRCKRLMWFDNVNDESNEQSGEEPAQMLNRL
jgi:hypothetical protein